MLTIIGFPFIRGDVRTALPALLSDCPPGGQDQGPSVLVCHQTFEGATVGPNGYRFRAAPDVIPRSALLASLTAVLAGHIHRSQILDGDGGPPVIYPGSTERTSFAERNEPKGFFDLEFAGDARGRWSLVEHAFIPLAARPMLDLVIPRTIAEHEIDAHLRCRSASLPGDAVVRVGFAPGTRPPGLEARLSAPHLRTLFPPTMSVHQAWRATDAGE